MPAPWQAALGPGRSGEGSGFERGAPIVQVGVEGSHGVDFRAAGSRSDPELSRYARGGHREEIREPLLGLVREVVLDSACADTVQPLVGQVAGDHPFKVDPDVLRLQHQDNVKGLVASRYRPLAFCVRTRHDPPAGVHEFDDPGGDAFHVWHVDPHARARDKAVAAKR